MFLHSVISRLTFDLTNQIWRLFQSILRKKPSISFRHVYCEVYEKHLANHIMVFRMWRYIYYILGQYLGKSYQSDILRLIQLFHSLAEFHTDVWVDWTTQLLFLNPMNSVSPCLPRPCRLFFRRQKMHGSDTKSRFDLNLEWPYIYIMFDPDTAVENWLMLYKTIWLFRQRHLLY